MQTHLGAEGRPTVAVTIETLPLGVGRQIGRYELLHEIGSGGMATVYLGRARGVAGFERVVAIKCCHQELRFDSNFVAMFLDEAKLAAKIHHPNAVAVLDVGDAEALYLVMDYVEGHSLQGLRKAATKQKTKIPVAVELRVALDVLAGLHAAHELRDADGKPLNLVHRDVSAQNVLVSVDGVSRITDFGIAKAEERQTVTPTGQIKGRFAYMAPEQLEGIPIDRRADVFAVGVLLWEGLTRQNLFRASNPTETIDALVNKEIARPSEVEPESPPELDAIVLKALERDRDKRYASAAEFIDALEKCSVRPATSREVGALVQELLAKYLAKRRDVIRQVMSERRAENTPVHVSPDASTSMGIHAIRGSDTYTGRRKGRRRIGSLVLGLGGALILLGGIGLGLAARGGSRGDTPAGTAANGPTTAPIAGPSHPVPETVLAVPPAIAEAPTPPAPEALSPAVEAPAPDEAAGASPSHRTPARARVVRRPRRMYRPRSI